MVLIFYFLIIENEYSYFIFLYSQLVSGGPHNSGSSRVGQLVLQIYGPRSWHELLNFHKSSF